jgi:hypothetical protein
MPNLPQGGRQVLGLHLNCSESGAAVHWPTPAEDWSDWSIIPKKPAPDLIRGVQRSSEKVMLK